LKRFLIKVIGLALMLSLLAAGCTALADKDLAVNPDLDPAWHNILLLGTDERPDEQVARTDTMIILSINGEEKAVRLTSLMRDMWVDIYGTKRSHKINAANVFGGTDAAMATVNHYFDLNIEEYILVDMEGLTQIINKLGGVEITLSAEEAERINRLIREEQVQGQQDVAEGENVFLTGEQALAFMRIRSIGDDQQRTARQRTVLLALAGKLKETSVWGLMDVAMTLMGYVETNIPLGTLIDLGMTAMDIDLSNAAQLRIPKDGAYTIGREEKSGLDVIWADFDKNTKILHEFIYGEQ